MDKDREKGAAFTLLELLVVLAVLVVLVALTLPALSASRSQTKIAQCAGNLRQLALAIHAYGSENNDRLPQAVSTGWAWDVPYVFSEAVRRCGAKRQNFYCPANPDQNTDALWNFTIPNYRVSGYVNTLPGTVNMVATNVNSLLTPQYSHIGLVTFPPQPASTRVLVADGIVSFQGQNNTAQKANYTYTGIMSIWSKPHRASHLDAVGRYPTGGNLGMLDGHVEWRPFENVEARTTGNNAPGFWW